MLYAQRLALRCKVPLVVGFCLVPKFLEATIRHFGFMLKELEEVEKVVAKFSFAFNILIELNLAKKKLVCQ